MSKDIPLWTLSTVFSRISTENLKQVQQAMSWRLLRVEGFCKINAISNGTPESLIYTRSANLVEQIAVA